MSISSRISALFASAKALFEDLLELITDEGSLFYEGALEVGTPVFSAPGEPAANGVYHAQNKLYTVLDGVISLIEDAPAEVPSVPSEGDMACVKKSNNEEVPAITEPVSDEPQESKSESNDVEQLRQAIEDLTSRLIVLEAKVQEIGGRPADVSPSEFSKVKVLTPEATRELDVEALKQVFGR